VAASAEPVRGVLLDFYGTVVVDDDEAVAGICADVAASVGRSGSDVGHAWGAAWDAMCRASVGAAFRGQRDLARASLAATLRDLGSPLDVDVLHARQVAHWTAPDAYDDALDLLATLRESDVPVCLVSDVDDVDLAAAVDRLGLDLPLRVTSEQVRAYKPDAAPFLRALDVLGLRADEVVHVGNSPSNDVAGASALAIRTAWVDRPRRPREVPATWRVTDLRDLVPVLAATG
jgi:2-haloacid dehalogenase/putative hydrolase of the HAD superfamily